MVDPRNFLLNTDYPLDKIVYMDSGSFTIPAGSYATSTKAHGKTFTPLATLSWSTSSTFTTSKESNIPVLEFTDPDLIQVNNYTNGTNIVIDGYNPTTSSKTIYWRAFGFMPSNVNVDTPGTATSSNSFQFNTDYNYCKLYNSGITTTATITHNLGYRPQVTAWKQTGSNIAQVNDKGIVKVGTTTVNIISTDNIHYRIYADGQL